METGPMLKAGSDTDQLEWFLNGFAARDIADPLLSMTSALALRKPGGWSTSQVLRCLVSAVADWFDTG
jgi:hypothetical protein